MDDEIASLVVTHENIARTCDILRSMLGEGAVSAAVILTLMRELFDITLVVFDLLCLVGEHARQATVNRLPFPCNHLPATGGFCPWP